MIAYSCFVLFLAYRNCKFKAGGAMIMWMLYLCYSVTSRCLLRLDNTCFGHTDRSMRKLFEEYYLQLAHCISLWK